MDVFLGIFTSLFNNVLSQPAFFMAILVLVGNIFLKKTVLESISGAMKAAIGYMILQIGASGMVKGFKPMLDGLLSKYDLTGAAVIDSNFGFAAANNAIEAMGESLSSTMLVLLIGFSVNIILLLVPKLTKVRTLFTTGHIMVKQAGFITYMLFFAMPAYRNMTGIIMIGILIGIYWAVFSNMTVEATQNLTNGERILAVGHSQMFGIWLTDKLAGKLGDPEDSVENLKLPGQLKAFSDNIFGTTVIMLLMFGGILTLLGKDVMMEFDSKGIGDMSYIAYVIKKSMSFTVNFIILQTGVKMFVGEITASFNGISGRLLKGSVPAVDCAATYGFAAPNTVLIGFVSAFVGQVLAIGGLVLFKSPILIITGFVPLFFDNATLAVFANKRGGRKAAIIIPFISGILQVLLGAVGVKMFELGAFGGWYGNLDLSTVWLVVGGVIKQAAFPGAIIMALAMLAIPQLQYKLNKETYFID